MEFFTRGCNTLNITFNWIRTEKNIKMKIKDFFIGFENGSKDFGEHIAVIINSVLLSIVYFLGVGGTSIIAKIFGKHFLDLKMRRKDSYWSELNLTKRPLEEYYRQF